MITTKDGCASGSEAARREGSAHPAPSSMTNNTQQISYSRHEPSVLQDLQVLPLRGIRRLSILSASNREGEKTWSSGNDIVFRIGA